MKLVHEGFMEPSDLVCVRKAAGKGRGVFARKAIKKGQIIERVPILLVPIDSLTDGLSNPVLTRFFYLWNKKNVAISLGYGSLYNHSYSPNAHYEHGTMSIIYSALRNIAKGEEITVNYNGDPKDKSPMGFKVL